ncbi:MAG: hypothetical protein A2W35_08790 [Chloroflexi bacterium RBG_16_57_11]|nr:MAG: hypothetical protein A2W35_08790 [Chloroflexi bacterium RBG_16_57_11]
MTDIPETQSAPPGVSLEQSWGTALAAVVCERCDWGFLIPEAVDLGRCPHCFQPTLGRIDQDVSQLPYTQPPELIIPYALSEAQLSQEIQRFASGIPYPPQDLVSKNLQARLQRVFLPMWLVDASVQAAWKAETGFNYQVVSHQDRYSGSGWASQQVKEGRVRWEPRLGRLDRIYTNIAAPALEDHAILQAALGEFNLTAVRTYQPEDTRKAFVRLPSRSPQDAWSDAQLALFNAAAEECRQAARADHLRQFSWQPEFTEQHWTQLLLPVYTAYYLDDDRQPQLLLIHGQSGKMNGVRRASMKRATRSALTVLGIAVLIFILGLILGGASLAVPPLLVPAILALALALLVGLGAIIPPVRAGWFNRSQKP